MKPATVEGVTPPVRINAIPEPTDVTWASRQHLHQRRLYQLALRSTQNGDWGEIVGDPGRRGAVRLRRQHRADAQGNIYVADPGNPASGVATTEIPAAMKIDVPVALTRIRGWRPTRASSPDQTGSLGALHHARADTISLSSMRFRDAFIS